MKRCPECRRDYTDETLNFCLDDGATLLDGPASGDESATVVLPNEIPSESPTRAQLHTTASAAEPQTHFGDSTEKQSFSAHRAAKPTAGRVSLVAAAIIIAALSASGLIGYRYFSNSGRINSIAVMPLQNSSGNADSEYLSDGLAESLIYRLSQLPELKVSPASSVMRYKGKEFDAQKIASELGVQAVMSGRMVQRGDNLSISVELIDAVNNKTIWGEQFERKMSDLMATQREIATVITEKLQLKLTGAEVDTFRHDDGRPSGLSGQEEGEEDQFGLLRLHDLLEVLGAVLVIERPRRRERDCY